MDVTEYVLAELTPARARVLEVGCGQGELAKALAQGGYEVTAIDPEAPTGPIFRQTTIEALDDVGPYDAVVASRSLHHVHDLDPALAKISALLRLGGILVLDELAWERLDTRSAQEVGIDLEEWREEHQNLYTSTTMLAALGARFEQRSFSWEPYLHREARQAVDEDAERQLIHSGRLAATGFRYVGVRRG